MLYVLFVLLIFATGATNIYLGLVASDKARKVLEGDEK